MNKTEQLKLKKELSRFEPFIAQLSRQDLVSGRWLPRFLEHLLGSYTVTTTPEEVRAAHPGVEEEQLHEAIISRAMYAAIAAPSAHLETGTSTDIRMLTDTRRGGTPQRLTPGAAAVVSELLYVLKLCVDLIFALAAAQRRRMDAGQVELVCDVLGSALGAFDWEGAKAKASEQGGDAREALGAKIYDRAIVQPLSQDHPLNLRKGFYCHFTKSVGRTALGMVGALPEWVEQPKEDEAATGAMMALEPDETGFMT
ncbi:MAG: hypothetical protein KatS3mg102_2262 [Planctomycetota bacterium]|nr:MAG: hypothetical protein KatS3mg102_2262 [Planctomycetota bacterium]